jgi:hypothetical protein
VRRDWYEQWLAALDQCGGGRFLASQPRGTTLTNYVDQAGRGDKEQRCRGNGDPRTEGAGYPS